MVSVSDTESEKRLKCGVKTNKELHETCPAWLTLQKKKDLVFVNPDPV